ncbi:hypothetical protein [Sphingopyxis sp. JAI128]|uniref:hypothetical protein n=1 Tax=Sphingopyxis sp. JAI128 TaxID=2723066 RepID=UPI00160942DE|nr:hypothetical protein [Sphingopyxis sp. JAI128]MBB6426272.1 hypothetical protein [Sphingopyxis sp. JAI128]
MVDRPPPSRFSVVERGGRLVVIDADTGQTPPSAAERMAEHDRRIGNERILPASRQAAAEFAPAVIAPPEPQRQPARLPNERMAAALADMTRKQPWGQKPRGTAHRPARNPTRPPPTADTRKTIVTSKWWDAKGPRTIELGSQGQRELTGGFMTLFFVALIAAIVALFIAPILLLVAAFLLFRFGGNILGPIGAGLIDKAITQKG